MESLANVISKVAKPLKSIDDVRSLAHCLVKGTNHKPRLSPPTVIMIGEASHGTHEFYEWRAELTKVLISKYGYEFVSAEADWPPCFDVTKKIMKDTLKGDEKKKKGEEALENFDAKKPEDANLKQARRMLSGRFHRWPTWMWANEDVAQFIAWLKEYNESVDNCDTKEEAILGIKREKDSNARIPVGFFGLDVYSLFDSIDVVLKEFDKIDPELTERAKKFYSCLDRFRDDEYDYVRSLLRHPPGCRDQTLKVLKEALQLRLDNKDKNGDKELAIFDAKQNAKIVANAESYYRSMIFGEGDESSWNVRDKHMMETLWMLLTRGREDDTRPLRRGIVWAHNTHIGDARATSMIDKGEINIASLAREKLGYENVCLVGLTTYEGSVIASKNGWGKPAQKLTVPKAKEGSVEAILYKTVATSKKELENFWTHLDKEEMPKAWGGHRAIGVVYNPDVERYGNYVPTCLVDRYNAFIFISKTRALDILPTTEDTGKLPETFPSDDVQI